MGDGARQRAEGLRKIAVFCDEMHFHLSLTKRTASNVGKRSRPVVCSCGQQEAIGTGVRIEWPSGQMSCCRRLDQRFKKWFPFFAAGSKVESLFKISRQAGVARIRARLATVLQ